MALTRYEMEVSIGWDAESKLVTVVDYRDKTYQTLTAAGYTPSLIHRIDGEVVGWTWHDIPVSDLRVKANGLIGIKYRDRERVRSDRATAFFAKQQRLEGKQGHPSDGS